ncbi:MAG: hypothetical protein J7497_09185, partial [Chitinophagaceae bacterium]|nr:hypothetical protein [Chitinophagaceae bacterium]
MGKKVSKPADFNNINQLEASIFNTNEFFLKQAQKQVNTTFTVRNWIIGFYIVEYEQNGVDRAEYGTGLLKNLAERFKRRAVKSLYETNLKLFRQFYLLYPEIRRTLSDESLVKAFPLLSEKSRTPSDESTSKKDSSLQKLMIDPNILVTRLSFSHFIELFKGETLLKRIFYETETITNNWSVRELAKAMNSMLFERTGLSKDKLGVLQRFKDGLNLMPDDVFRNPYLLD